MANGPQQKQQREIGTYLPGTSKICKIILKCNLSNLVTFINGRLGQRDQRQK